MAKSLALGTVLRIEDPDTPESFLDVGNLTSLTVPGPTKPEIDVTDFDSTAAEYLGGLPDNGEVSGSGFFNYTDTGQIAMLEDAHDPTSPERDFEIYFERQGVTFMFSGYVSSYVPNAPGPTDAYTFDFTIRVSGAVAIAEDS